jgi:dihydropyrimidine dehydrogenase (NAD+) subunit PreA
LVDLSVDIGEIKLKSPIFLAAGPLTVDIRHLQKAVETGVGAIDTKDTVAIRYPKIKSYQRTYWDSELQAFYWNIGNWEDEYLYVDDAVSLITSLKEKLNVPVFGNVNIRNEEPEKGGIEIGSRLEEAGADALIVYYWGTPPIKLAEKAYRELCSSIKIPVICKMPTIVWIADPAQVAKDMERTGVSAIQISDVLAGLPSLNIESAPYHPFPAIDKVDISLISGPLLRPLVYLGVYEMSRAVKIPVIASGGIWTAKHAIEAILYGASAVATASGPVLMGWRMVKEVIDGIKDYMERNNYSKIEDFKGLAQQYFGVRRADKIKFDDCVATVNESLCNGCGNCLIPAHCEAIKIIEKVAVADESCRGCCICSYLCSQQAITISKI